MPSSWRGRSSMTTITSPIVDARRSATSRERLRERAVEVEQVGDVVAAGELLHVDARAGVEHRAALGQRDDGQRAGHALARLSVVPSSGSTAMSTCGGEPSPICSPL